MSVIIPPPEQAPAIAGVTDAFAMFRVFSKQPKEFEKFMNFWEDWLARYETVIKSYADIQKIEGLKGEAEVDRKAAEQDRQDAAAALKAARDEAQKIAAQSQASATSVAASLKERQNAMSDAEAVIDAERQELEDRKADLAKSRENMIAEVEAMKAAVVARETVVNEHLARLRAAGFDVVG